MGQVTVVLTGDSRRLLREIEKVGRAEERLAQQTERVGTASENASRRAEAGLRRQGRQAESTASQVAKMAAGYLSVQAALNAARDAGESLYRTLEQNKQAALGAVGAFQRFSSIGNRGSAADRQFLLNNAGAINPNVAAGIGFTARSAGYKDPQIAALLRQANAARVLGEDPGRFADAVVGIRQSALGDKSIGQAASFLFEQAKGSPLDISTFAETYGRLGGLAGQTDEQRAGSARALSAQVRALGGNVAGAPQRAATALRSFLGRGLTEQGQEFFKSQGIRGLTLDRQLVNLSRRLERGQLSEQEFLGFAGQESGPALLGLLRSKEGLAALQGGGPGSTQSAGSIAALREYERFTGRKAGSVSGVGITRGPGGRGGAVILGDNPQADEIRRRSGGLQGDRAARGALAVEYAKREGRSPIDALNALAAEEQAAARAAGGPSLIERQAAALRAGDADLDNVLSIQELQNRQEAIRIREGFRQAGTTRAITQAETFAQDIGGGSSLAGADRVGNEIKAAGIGGFATGGAGGAVGAMAEVIGQRVEEGAQYGTRLKSLGDPNDDPR